MRPLLVSDLMTEDVFTLRASDDLTALYDLMDAEHIRHIPVIDGESEVVGLVTHRDLLRSALDGQADLPLSMQREILGRMTVGRIMIRDIETIEPDASIGEAAQLMLDNKYGCLPVVEGKRLVGILTEADFVRCLAGMIPGVSLEIPARASGKKTASPGSGIAASGKSAAGPAPHQGKSAKRSPGPAPRTAR
jgi:CBS domain-containing membrane protein